VPDPGEHPARDTRRASGARHPAPGARHPAATAILHSLDVWYHSFRMFICLLQMNNAAK